MSEVANTRPDPLAMITSYVAPTELRFTHSNIQEPDDPETTSNSFFRSYMGNTPQQTVKSFDGSRLFESYNETFFPRQTEMEEIREDTEEADSINENKEVTMQVEKYVKIIFLKNLIVLEICLGYRPNYKSC